MPSPDRQSRHWSWFLVVSLLGTPAISVAPAIAAETASVLVTLSGPDGVPLAGAAVEVAARGIEGSQSARTDQNGSFWLSGPFPGEYTLKVESANRWKATVRVLVKPDGTLNYVLDEQNTPLPDAVRMNDLSSTVSADKIANLPLVRRNFPAVLVNFAPWTTSGPNPAQVSIGGAISRDSLILVDGGINQENSFGTAAKLLPEDAFSRVRVSATGASAEYGGSTGGVVNVSLKSGGNDFAGSLRLNLGSEGWRADTPFEKETSFDRKGSDRFLSATFGGPIIRDKTFFFLTYQGTSFLESKPLALTGIPYDTKATDNGVSGKLSYTPRPSHQVTASYIGQLGHEQRPSDSNAATISTLIKPTLYGGFLNADYEFSNDDFSVETRYSQRAFTQEDAGGGSGIQTSPQFDLMGSFLGNYQAGNGLVDEVHSNQFFGAKGMFQVPRFCDVSPWCDDHQVTGGVNRFSHALEASYQFSGSGFAFATNFQKNADGTLVVNPGGFAIPIWQTDVSQLRSFDSAATKSEAATSSIFFSDRWTTNRLRMDVGIRYDKTNVSVDDQLVGGRGTYSPRVSAAYAVSAFGGWTVNASWGIYAGSYAPKLQCGNCFRDRSSVSIYRGPTMTGPNSMGAFDLGNWQPIAGIDTPGITDVVQDIGTTTVRDSSVGVTHMSMHGRLTVAFLDRTTVNFVEDGTGPRRTVVKNGLSTAFDGIEVFDTDSLTRDYRAIGMNFVFNPWPKLSSGGNYTWQIKNDGDYPGEDVGASTQTSAKFNYEGVLDGRNYLTGRLPGFTKNDLSLWANWRVYERSAFDVSLSAFFRAKSGAAGDLPYVTYTLTDIQRSIAAVRGYIRVPAQVLHFSPNADWHLDSDEALDVGLTYTRRIGSRRVQAGVQMFNVKNSAARVAFNRVIIPVETGPRDDKGRATTYIQGPDFGKTDSADDYQDPRAYKFWLATIF